MVAEYMLLLRTASNMKAVHDRHVEGLFSVATWRRVLTDAGFHVDTAPRPLDDATSDQVFLCRRP